jgi:hypothetical protein
MDKPLLFQTKQMSITDFLGSDLGKHINTTFIIFVEPSAECKIFTFVWYLWYT